MSREKNQMLRQADDKYLFLRDADYKMTTVIEPVMRRIIKELHSRGREAVVARESQSISESGILRYRHITLILSGDNKKPVYNFSPYPAIAFVADSENETILVRERRITMMGKKENCTGNYRTEEITTDLVEKHVRVFLPKAVKERF